MAAPSFPKSQRLFLVTIALLVLGVMVQNGSAQVCNANVSGLISECRRYVEKSGPMVPPSAACCDLVKPINVRCACGYVTKEVENMISMDKAVYVGRSCGKRIPAGMKCGSYTVPGA